MNIIPPSPFGIVTGEYQSIRRVMMQRATEWREKRGIPRLLAVVKIYFWARRQTISINSARSVSRRV